MARGMVILCISMERPAIPSDVHVHMFSIEVRTVGLARRCSQCQLLRAEKCLSTL